MAKKADTTVDELSPAMQEAAVGTEVTRVEHRENGIIGRAVFGGIEDVTLSLWSSMPLTRRADIIGLMQGNSERLGNVIGEVIEVEHVLAHRVDMIDEETGEVTTGDRVILVDRNGRSFAGVSVGVRKSLQFIMALYGMPPWTPELKLRVGQIETKRGRTFTLKPVEN